MAKAKKKSALSLEERLERALVPEAEQPYPVPENWCWTRLDYIAEYKKGPFGSSITKAMFVPKNDDTYKVYEQGNAIQKNCNYGSYYINSEKYEELKSFAVQSGDIIVSCAGTIGEIYQLPNDIQPGIINQALMRIRIRPIIELEIFLYYFGQVLTQDITLKSKGTAIKNIPPFSILKNMYFPLPPLTEQQRIVDRIESLFSKLDEAKEKAQAALDSFETRKAAILHKAFTGELTRKWREKNGIGLASWEKKNLQSVCSMRITDGTHKTPTYCNADEGIPFISAKDVTSGEICWDNIKYIVPELHEELYARLAPEMDDILLAKNGTTGVAAIVNVTKVFDLYVTIALLRPNKNIINPRYLLNVINSPICKVQFDEHLTGIGVPNLHLRDIKEILIPLPTLCEQAEIVHLLNNFFVREQRAKELCSVLDKIDLIKKSILARAFRGELGTNDPTEESAIELLKNIVSIRT